MCRDTECTQTTIHSTRLVIVATCRTVPTRSSHFDVFLENIHTVLLTKALVINQLVPLQALWS